MNGVRIAISAFILILLVVVSLGWSWTAAHQPPSQAVASHIVLAIAALAGIFALVTIWRPDRSRSGAGRS